MCSWEGFLDLENEEYVVFYLLSVQVFAILWILIWEYLSPGGQTLAAEPGANLSPASESFSSSTKGGDFLALEQWFYTRTA